MLVSIVIPTHKRSKKIIRAVESALAQTYQDIEIVVVSDGYDESTDEAMSRYDENPKVNYITYKNNRGGNYARNLGVENSNGKFIAFLDDDDVMEPTKVEKQMDVFLEDTEVGLVYTGFKSIYPSYGISYTHKPKKQGFLPKEIFASNFIGSTSRVMVKKDIMKEAGMFDISMPALQDYDLWMRICQITKIGFVSEPLLTYINENENNQISKNASKKREAIKIITEKYATYFEDKDAYYEEFDKRYYKLMLSTAQSNNDSVNLSKFSKEYLSKYSKISDRIFVLKYKIPFKLALRFRSLSGKI